MGRLPAGLAVLTALTVIAGTTSSWAVASMFTQPPDGAPTALWVAPASDSEPAAHRHRSTPAPDQAGSVEAAGSGRVDADRAGPSTSAGSPSSSGGSGASGSSGSSGRTGSSGSSGSSARSGPSGATGEDAGKGGAGTTDRSGRSKGSATADTSGRSATATPDDDPTPETSASPEPTDAPDDSGSGGHGADDDPTAPDD